MKNYAEIKKFVLDRKTQIILSACFVLVFIVGFGTGRYENGMAAPSSKTPHVQQNYTTKTTTTPINKEGEVKGAATPTATAKTATDAGNCVVKGNIASSGKKIYHVQGGAFYKTVKPEQCFDTEEAASAAGFVKSSR